MGNKGTFSTWFDEVLGITNTAKGRDIGITTETKATGGHNERFMWGSANRWMQKQGLEEREDTGEEVTKLLEGYSIFIGNFTF